MQKMKYGVSKMSVFRNIRVLALSAVLVAMSIVCGKFLAFNLGNVLRISFENLPILLGGILFGPIVGTVIGVAADLIGCLMVGYAINPLVTLGAASIGALSGLLGCVTRRLPLGVRILLSVGIAHLIGSVGIKTFGLSVFYDMPIRILMLWRALNYLIVGVIEGLLLGVVLKNKTVDSLMRKYGTERKNEDEI